jgi:DNA-directed RNA polymerase subunit RPC12/RpoP
MADILCPNCHRGNLIREKNAGKNRVKASYRKYYHCDVCWRTFDLNMKLINVYSLKGD